MVDLSLQRNRSVINDVIPEVEDYNWGVLFLSPLVLFGITGNVMVCLAISLEKRLQTVTNYFLLSLAVTDLLVCIIVMPISILNELHGHWHFSITMCNVFITADVLMCTSSILHLCSISVQRYLAISRPLKWRNKSKSIVVVKIGLIWLAAIVISSPVSILGALDRVNILNDRQCMLKNSSFIIYGSILAFFIPLVIMVISYALTARLLYKKSKLSDPCKGGDPKEGVPVIRRSKSTRRKTGGSTASNSPVRDKQQSDYSNGIRKDKLNYNSNSDDIYSNIQRVSPQEDSQLSVCKPHSHESMISSSELKQCFLEVPRIHGFDFSNESLQNTDNPDTDMEISEDDNSKSLTMSLTQLHPPGSPGGASLRSTIMFKACSFLNLSRTEKHSDRSTVRTEQKASKVLGLVFALFVLCWSPFFVLNVLPVLCSSCQAHHAVISTFAWLGWSSSTINPIIYTMFNKTFKRTFIKLLCCKYRCKTKSRQLSPGLTDSKRPNESVLIRHSA